MNQSQDIAPERQQEILQRFRGGDTEIFSEVYTMYYEPVFKFLLRRTSDSFIAYDLTADVFLKAFHSFGQFRWTGVSLKSWIFRIAHNSLKNYYRSKKLFIHPLENIPDEVSALAQDALSELQEAEVEYDQVQQSKKVEAHISTLQPRYREALGLKYSAGLSMKEIGEVMNLSESAVKSILHRAHSKLRLLAATALFFLIFLSNFPL